MLEVVGLSSSVTILLILALSGTISWGITQVIRAIARHHQDAAWHTPVLRGVAILIGGLVGLATLPSILGVCLGLSAGVLNTTIIAVVKKRLKRAGEEV